MRKSPPTITTAGPNGRQFATVPVAMQAIIINEAEEFLLLSSPTRGSGWQIISGAMEPHETLLDGTLREALEEGGADLRLRPLGVVHAETFRYDAQVTHMLSLFYLFAYEGGNIVPGDDMVGSEVRWWSLAEINSTHELFHVAVKPWMLQRAVELYRLWFALPVLPLQPQLSLG